jgi:hypothetical protein
VVEVKRFPPHVLGSCGGISCAHAHPSDGTRIRLLFQRW